MNFDIVQRLLVPAAPVLPVVLLVALLAALAPSSSVAQPPDELPAADAAAPALAERAAASYRARARFPEHSHPVPAGAADPVRARRTPERHALPAPGGEGPRLTLWPAEVGFTAPEPVVLHASLEGQGRSPVRGAFITGEVIGSAGDTVGSVVYRDDGVAPDERSGDGVYTALFELAPERTPALAESFLVQVLATLPGDEEPRQGAAGFLYGNPSGRLTGAFSDRLEEGSVVIAAEVAVETAGRFHLEGTLHSMSGEPLAWAQSAVELEPGVHRVELEFYGLALRERGAAGPYRLGTVALSTTGTMPNALGELLENAHRTRPYPLGALTARPFGQRDLLEAAERLERSRSGGR